jgi:Flp pilus assembly pilin Flp
LNQLKSANLLWFSNGKPFLTTFKEIIMNKGIIKQTGQGMTEYIIIVALIAVAAIGVYQFFGQTIRAQMSGIANEVAGKSAAESINKAGTAADKAKAEADASKGLSTYSADATRGQ